MDGRLRSARGSRIYIPKLVHPSSALQLPSMYPSARGHTKGSSGRARAHTAVQGSSPREILLHNIITLPAPVFLSITRVGAAGFKMVKLIGQAQHLPPDGGGGGEVFRKHQSAKSI